MTQRNNKADRTRMGAHKNVRVLQRQLKAVRKREEKERGRAYGLEFSKPAHTRPQNATILAQIRTPNALIIIQNSTLRLTYSSSRRPPSTPGMSKKKNNKRATLSIKVNRERPVLGSGVWDRLGYVGSHSGFCSAFWDARQLAVLNETRS